MGQPFFSILGYWHGYTPQKKNYWHGHWDTHDGASSKNQTAPTPHFTHPILLPSSSQRQLADACSSAAQAEEETEISVHCSVIAPVPLPPPISRYRYIPQLHFPHFFLAFAPLTTQILLSCAYTLMILDGISLLLLSDNAMQCTRQPYLVYVGHWFWFHNRVVFFVGSFFPLPLI